MLIHAVARNRGVFMFTLGALLVVAAAERTTFAQDAQAPSSAAQLSQPQSPLSQPQSPPAAAQAPGGFLSEPHMIKKSVDFVTSKFGDGNDEPKSGFYPELSNMITGAGWLAAGPGYRHYFSNDRILLDGSAAASWHFYKMVQGKFELPKLANDRLIVGVQGMWQDQTQVSYFGSGPDSLDANHSLYRMQTTNIVGYATGKLNNSLSLEGGYGWLMRPKLMAPGGTFSPNLPDTSVQLPGEPGINLSEQPNFLYARAAVMSDTRDHRSYPSSGGMYRAAATLYSDQNGGTFSFNRYEAEGTQFIPLSEKRWVLAIRGWTLYSAIPSGNQIPFYMLPGIGGNNTLRDFPDYRFHDNNLLLANAESRWALYEHVDAAVFFDAGNVAAQFSDLNLKKTSYGAGVRLHTRSVTFGRADVAYGSEGWRFVFRTNDPLRLSRVTRKIAAVPFNP